MMSGAHGSPAKLVSSAVGFPQAIPPSVIAVVSRAIHAAWAVVEADPVSHLAPASSKPEEDRYTEAIANILDHWLRYPDPKASGFTSAVFDTVVRGENLTNFNEAKLNKMPDLVIRLANAPLVSGRRVVGVVIETKIVSATRNISAYTKEGVSRFVCGDYAWAMQDALMIAYQREPVRSIDTLSGALKKQANLFGQSDAVEHLTIDALPFGVTGRSTHSRPWVYLSGSLPGNIRLWHMWALNLPKT